MHFNLQPTLQNKFVLLRPLRAEDFNPLYEVAKDPGIWEQHPCHDRYQRNVFASFFEESLTSMGALVVIDQATSQLIGSSRYKCIPGIDTAVEIGWSFLARKYWGGLYNKSMKRLMMDYAFQFVKDIIFYVGTENIRSQKAVEKIGGIQISGVKFQKLIQNHTSEITYRIRKKE